MNKLIKNEINHNNNTHVLHFENGESFAVQYGNDRVNYICSINAAYYDIYTEMQAYKVRTLKAETVTHILEIALATWQSKLKYSVNFEAVGNVSQLDEFAYLNVVTSFQKRGDKFFVEIKENGAMYPNVVYLVEYKGNRYNDATDSDMEEDYASWCAEMGDRN